MTARSRRVRAKAVLLATGGFGRMFRITSNAWSLTGDGVALAYRHGVPMEDMEFYQFHPTGIVGIGILLSEAARGEGGILLNGDGERFMQRYAPTMMDLAPRDMVSRAIYQEVRAGRGIDGKDYVYLDLRHLDRKFIDEKLPDITDFVRVYQGIEPLHRSHPDHADGPLRDGRHPDRPPRPGDTRRRRGPSFPGCMRQGSAPASASTGRTGSGTNSLVDLLVFGRRAGRTMATDLRGRGVRADLARRRGAGPGRDRGAPRVGRPARTRPTSARTWPT